MAIDRLTGADATLYKYTPGTSALKKQEQQLRVLFTRLQVKQLLHLFLVTLK